jgi:hypothetical protein
LSVEVEMPILTWDEAALRKENALWRPAIFHGSANDSLEEAISRLKSELQAPSREFLKADGALVPFDVSLNSNFDWSKQIEILDRLQALEKKAFIYLDFGFGKSLTSLEDSGLFMSLGLGLDQLNDKVLSKYSKVIEAAFLTWNATSFSELITWTPKLERDFFETLPKDKSFFAPIAEIQSQNLSIDSRLYLETFSKELVTSYLNFLITQLPAYLPALIHFSSSSSINFESAPMRLCYLFERRSVGSAFLAWSETSLNASTLYFGPYGEIPIAQTDSEVTVGVLLPELKLGLDYERLYSRALRTLQEKGINARCIPSEVFHEEWHLIDRAIGASAALSYEAFRQLVGFSVSGGEYLYLDSKSPHLDETVQSLFESYSLRCD